MRKITIDDEAIAGVIAVFAGTLAGFLQMLIIICVSQPIWATMALPLTIISGFPFALIGVLLLGMPFYYVLKALRLNNLWLVGLSGAPMIIILGWISDVYVWEIILFTAICAAASSACFAIVLAKRNAKAGRVEIHNERTAMDGGVH